MEKICFRCGLNKPIDDFYSHPRMSDGHLGKCKDCTKKDTIKNRIANKAYYLEYDRLRSNDPERVAGRYAYQRTDRGRKSHKRANEEWSRKNPRKRAAQILFRNRVRDGKIAIKPCERCGSDKVHGHHENYDKPLEVVWLCARHHKARHREMKQQGIEP